MKNRLQTKYSSLTSFPSSSAKLKQFQFTRGQSIYTNIVFRSVAVKVISFLILVLIFAYSSKSYANGSHFVESTNGVLHYSNSYDGAIIQRANDLYGGVGSCTWSFDAEIDVGVGVTRNLYRQTYYYLGDPDATTYTFYGNGATSCVGYWNGAPNGYVFRYDCDDGYTFDEITHTCIVFTPPDTPAAEPVANQGDCPEQECPETNPINGANGNKYQRETDYTSSINNGVRFERYYNSLEAELKPGILGAHWRGTYDRTVEVTIDTATSETVIVNYRPDGQGVFFVDNAGVWTPTIDLTLQLVELKDEQGMRTGWQLTTSDNNIEAYDADGILISITNLQGLTQTLEYDLTAAQGGDDNPDTLDKVTGPFGRTISFSYDAVSRLTTVTDPAGNIYSYGYSLANSNLITVTYPDETPGDSNDNPTRTYHYEDVNFDRALTGITDENGNRFASWGYDTQGRAIFSEHANGAERADLVYNVDGTTTITNALGQVRTYHFETHNSVHVTSQIDGDPCVSCGDSTTQNKTYDANGFVASRTDFNGNVTTFINDSRGLQTSRTEAVGTAEERTITTEWHTTFRLPTKITEPGKITNFTYDPQGRLLERKEEVAP